MTPEWERAVLSGDIAALERGLRTGLDIDARDRYGQTGLMLAALHGDDATVAFLVERGASLDHTAKYRLSALMLAAVNGRHEVARMLVSAGADLTLRGSGAPGFAGKTAYDLALQRGDDEMMLVLRRSEPG